MDIPNAIVGLNGPSQRLGGKIALVTGGGSGIGRATCLCFGSEGAAVIVVDRDRASAIDTVALIEAGGGRAFALGADVVSDATTIVDTALEQFGGLHICMNNAGIDLPSAKGVVETTDADLDRILAVNVVGLFRVSRAAIPAIRASGGGTIINVGSTAAEVGVRDEAAYAASKGAVVSLTRQMATDYAPEIRRQRAVPRNGRKADHRSSERVRPGGTGRAGATWPDCAARSGNPSRRSCGRRTLSRQRRILGDHRHHAVRRRRLNQVPSLTTTGRRDSLATRRWTSVQR